MGKFLLGFSAAVLMFAVMKVFAGEPGSASDPMVTKSFLEEFYGWRIVTISPGEKMALELGSEIILRSGKAVVVAGKAAGLDDLTLGRNLEDQMTIMPNHYIVSASSDGRGVKALTNTVFLARGLVR